MRIFFHLVSIPSAALALLTFVAANIGAQVEARSGSSWTGRLRRWLFPYIAHPADYTAAGLRYRKRQWVAFAWLVVSMLIFVLTSAS